MGDVQVLVGLEIVEPCQEHKLAALRLVEPTSVVLLNISFELNRIFILSRTKCAVMSVISAKHTWRNSATRNKDECGKRTLRHDESVSEIFI